MTQTTIRPIAEQDIPDVLVMVKALAAHHDDTPTVTLDSLRREALGEKPWLTLLVAERQGGLAGYAALCPLVQLQFGVRGMDMHHLFVNADQRGRGVGRALIEGALDAARRLGCRYMTVGTHPDNHAAAQVYLRSGFDAMPPPGPRFRLKWEL